MQIVSLGDNLHEMSKPIFWKKIRKYFKILSAEVFTQNAKRQILGGVLGYKVNI